MTQRHDSPTLPPVDRERRGLLIAAGVGALAAGFGGLTYAAGGRTLRWGVVGTGLIANSMAPRIQEAGQTELAAVSSRRMESAREFAGQHKVGRAFDSWEEMLAWDGIDAVYIATPTSVREEIGVAAAQAGKHVLGEKPFANLASLKRITAACRSNGVGFMDGTHFPHEPRTAHIKARLGDTGWPWSVASAFQFGLSDTSNIRLRPDLEPYGAIGDAGWYNMRAAVEYTAPGVQLVEAQAFLRRHEETGAIIAGSGVMHFDDGSTTTFNCGFESPAGVQDLRISSTRAVIKMDDYLRASRPDFGGAYLLLGPSGQREEVVVPAPHLGATLMFEDFAAMVGDRSKIEASMAASERTQAWLDAFWNSAVER